MKHPKPGSIPKFLKAEMLHFWWPLWITAAPNWTVLVQQCLYWFYLKITVMTEHISLPSFNNWYCRHVGNQGCFILRAHVMGWILDTKPVQCGFGFSHPQQSVAQTRSNRPNQHVKNQDWIREEFPNYTEIAAGLIPCDISSSEVSKPYLVDDQIA